MAARLDCRHITVNQKILVKISKFGRLLPLLNAAVGTCKSNGVKPEKFALQLFA
jgi:hypothetical protein